MIEHINLDDIRFFVMIAELGSFTKVAEQQGVSRSHISRRISALEQKIGVTLLNRTTRTLSLTESGKTLCNECQTALLMIDQALLQAVDDVEKIQGTIKVNSVGGYLGEEVIAQMTTAFMKQYPHINVMLDFSSHRVDLIEEEFDVAFRMGQLADSGFIAQKIMDIEMSTLASPSYIAENAEIVHPSNLAEHRCLVGSVRRWSYQSKADNASCDVNVKGVLESKNGRVLVKGAVQGNGVIRVPTLYCSKEIATGALTEVFSDWQIPSVDFSVLYHKDRYQPKRLKAFIQFVKNYVSTMALSL